MKVKLTKITSTHQNLRTTEVEGETDALPEVGKPFVMTGAPLDPAASFRIVYTTPVKSLEIMDKCYKFMTENSTYLVEVSSTASEGEKNE